MREGLNPTIRPFAGNNLGSQPGAGAPSGTPKGEAQGISKRLPVLAGALSRPISRANANALAAEGDAGEDYCSGGVIGIGCNPHPGTAGRGLVAQPVGEGGDLGGGVPLGQRISRRRGGRRRAWPMRSAAAKRPEPPSSTTTRSLPAVDGGTGETSGTIQGQASHSPEARNTMAPGRAAFTASGSSLLPDQTHQVPVPTRQNGFGRS